jgi:hypothetical protein
MRTYGTVTVEVVLDEKRQSRFSNCDSGPTMLRDSAVQVALKSRFSPTKLLVNRSSFRRHQLQVCTGSITYLSMVRRIRFDAPFSPFLSNLIVFSKGIVLGTTGHLSDLSLSELIEFFCNQRKSGRLKVLYPRGAGYFYLQAGSVVDARIGVLRGIDAVYYALTLPNAEFEFSVDAETSERTINQPWTQVVLEGLRRLDESISPSVAFPPDYVAEPDELEVVVDEEQNNSEQHRPLTPAFLRFGTSETHVNRGHCLLAQSP